jgi:hypothetical protein
LLRNDASLMASHELELAMSRKRMVFPWAPK